MVLSPKVQSTIAQAVAYKRAKDGHLPWDHEPPKVVIDNSPIREAQLEQLIAKIANNIHGSTSGILKWSEQVGEVLEVFDETIGINSVNEANIKVALSHLKAALVAPEGVCLHGYIHSAIKALDK